jgi:hypothetical protein
MALELLNSNSASRSAYSERLAGMIAGKDSVAGIAAKLMVVEANTQYEIDCWMLEDRLVIEAILLVRSLRLDFVAVVAHTHCYDPGMVKNTHYSHGGGLESLHDPVPARHPFLDLLDPYLYHPSLFL